jgi:hypothetical protein
MSCLKGIREMYFLGPKVYIENLYSLIFQIDALYTSHLFQLAMKSKLSKNATNILRG